GPDNASSTALEGLLQRDRWWVLAGLTATVALCWFYLVPMSLDMYGGMSGPSRWMMVGSWDGRYFSLMLLMWAVMMAGMMLPSAAPVILLYGAVLRKSAPSAQAVPRVYAFMLGYLLAWAGFSLLATLLQWGLSRVVLLSPMMLSRSPLLGGAILFTAGLYQWTPLKQACLRICRSPAEFIARHWRSGLPGALRMGAGHGLFCIGCCWALMLLLFFGGVMNLLWIAAISIAVLLEKLAPLGVQGGKLSGLLLLITGVVVAITG
ncbi:MAG: DUF2182 domain-containing protein, partial [Stenotrophobium sp.]